MMLRIFLGILLGFSACALPWLATILLGGLLVAKYEKYYEIVPIFFLNDAIYGVSEPRFFGFPFLMTLIATVMVLLSFFVRSRMFESAFIRR